MNENGEALTEMCANNKLILTNTMYQHKMAHRTTWEIPGPKPGRRNPYRYQIDYIIVKNSHRMMITDSRSYSGINTNTDHRLVMAKFNLEWHKLKKSNNRRIINIDNLKNENKKQEYQEIVREKLNHKNEQNSEKLEI